MRARCTASTTCPRRTRPSATSFCKIPFWKTLAEEALRPSSKEERSTMKVALAGAGAFGVKHLEAMTKIDGIEVVALIGRTLEATKEVAAKFGVGHVTTELSE